jgi:hypothetical protein
LRFWNDFCLPAWSNFSPMLDHHARTCDFSGANVSRVYTQGVFPGPVWFGGPPACGCRESVHGRGSASCDPMFVLWEPFRVFAVVPLTINVGDIFVRKDVDSSTGQLLSRKNASRSPWAGRLVTLSSGSGRIAYLAFLHLHRRTLFKLHCKF